MPICDQSMSKCGSMSDMYETESDEDNEHTSDDSNKRFFHYRHMLARSSVPATIKHLETLFTCCELDLQHSVNAIRNEEYEQHLLSLLCAARKGPRTVYKTNLAKHLLLRERHYCCLVFWSVARQFLSPSEPPSSVASQQPLSCAKPRWSNIDHTLFGMAMSMEHSGSIPRCVFDHALYNTTLEARVKHWICTPKPHRHNNKQYVKQQTKLALWAHKVHCTSLLCTIVQSSFNSTIHHPSSAMMQL